MTLWQDPRQATVKDRVAGTASAQTVRDVEAWLDTDWRGRPKGPVRRDGKRS